MTYWGVFVYLLIRLTLSAYCNSCPFPVKSISNNNWLHCLYIGLTHPQYDGITVLLYDFGCRSTKNNQMNKRFQCVPEISMKWCPIIFANSHKFWTQQKERFKYYKKKILFYIWHNGPQYGRIYQTCSTSICSKYDHSDPNMVIFVFNVIKIVLNITVSSLSQNSIVLRKCISRPETR